MPHMTAVYPFEFKIFENRYIMVGRVGEGGCLIWFDGQGEPVEMIFKSSESWHGIRKRLDNEDRPFFLFDPFDIEFHWIGWHKLSQDRMERFLGIQFEAADFVKHPFMGDRMPDLDPPGFPTSWNVMF